MSPLSERTAPLPALSNRERLARSLDGSDGLTLGVDFDGTLAPIVEDSDAPVITDRARAALTRLADHSRVTVAVVSGRELSDLVGRVDIEGLVYAGNHGLEVRAGERTLVHPAAARQRPRIEALSERIRERLADFPACTVEDKGLTATVHVRGSEDADRAISLTESLAADAGSDVRVVSGKRVRELRPTVNWDKGATMDMLTDATPVGHRPLFVGDDTTDEDAFRSVQPDGVGVKVRSDAPMETGASFGVAGQTAVPRLLEWLAEYADERWPTDRRAGRSATAPQLRAEELTAATDTFVTRSESF